MRFAPLLIVTLACNPTSERPPIVTPDTPEVTDPTEPEPTTGAACEVELPGADVVAGDPTCGEPLPAVVDPWSAVLEQRLLTVSPAHTPVVGHLDDDNGDGVVGSGDIPEIVAVDRFAGSFGAAVAVWSKGKVKFEFPYDFNENIAPLIGDIDGDGDGEVVLGGDGYLDAPIVALDAKGQEVWRSEVLDLQCLDDGRCETTAADLDGDGVAEIIVGGHVLDGATGATKFTLDLDTYWPAAYRGVIAADLDQDGWGEIIVGDRAFDADGDFLWAVAGQMSMSAMPALAQLDADPEAEVVISRFDELLLLEHDGVVIDRIPLPGAVGTKGYAGLPCVGDLDGDGASEIVVPSGSTIDAFAADGAVLWSAPMSGNDGTGWIYGMLGCSVFDFDGDGADEVAFGDAYGLRILSGADGGTLWGTAEYAGYTEGQVPVVADVDGDGAAELVASSTGHLLNPYDWMGVQVYGHDGAGWSAAGSAWGTHDYAGAAIDELPATWVSPGRFRGRAVAGAGAADADLTVDVVDHCGCEGGVAKLSVVVGNEGVLAADAVFEVVAVRPEGEAVLHEGTIAAVAPGVSAPAVEIVLDREDVDGAEVVVRLLGAACDMTDNEAVVVGLCD